MDFGLSKEQQLLVQTVARYLDEHCSLGAVRAAAEQPRDVAEALVKELNELGVMPLLIPERFGGSGLGVLDAALVQECLGYHVAPVPFLSQTLAVQALLDTQDDALMTAWLTPMAAGDVNVAVALNEARGAREGAGLRSEVAADNTSRLHGKTLFAADIHLVTHVLLQDGNGLLHLADVAQAGFVSTELETIDRSRRSYELVLDDVAAVALPRGANVARLLVVQRILLAADSLGAASAMLDKAVDYAKQREQFGRLIGSFQAVKHMCADMAARLEPCRALMWYAAHAFDNEQDDALLMAVLLKSHLAEVGQFVARTSTEVHGGMGFTELLGLHYWFKRIGANRQLGGTPERLREEAARLQGWV
jgi:alkylation response protein AidB-like acyl-CoA dehydrogenase